LDVAESTIKSLIRRAASAYVAGRSLEDACAVCDRLARDGVSSTVCYWDAYSDCPSSISQAYIGLLDATSNLSPNCYLSIKAPALNFDIDLVRKVVEEARKLHAVVHFDAMAPETVDRTFDLICEARKIYSNLGCTLPGRWKRSLNDVERVVDLGLRVRVVKGEWRGIGDDETDSREGFVGVIERLSGRALHVAVATHNASMARLSLRLLKKAGTPCELELLYGLPQQPMLEIARDLGVRSRLYVPYGRAGLPYRLKESARNLRIIGWFMHDLLRGKSDPGI
jgi:proline dehydrogenase